MARKKRKAPKKSKIDPAYVMMKAKKAPPPKRKVNFELLESTIRRLEEAKWRVRKPKWKIIQDALEAYLDKVGV